MWPQAGLTEAAWEDGRGPSGPRGPRCLFWEALGCSHGRWLCKPTARCLGTRCSLHASSGPSQLPQSSCVLKQHKESELPGCPESAQPPAPLVSTARGRVLSGQPPCAQCGHGALSCLHLPLPLPIQVGGQTGPLASGPPFPSRR